MKLFPDFSYEQEYWQQQYAVIGIDEVGRGCLAGPVTVGGVCLQNRDTVSEWLSVGINDSKKLLPKTREDLSVYIKKNAIHAVSFIDTEKINTLGIVGCILEGISEVVIKIQKSLPNNKIILLIDGLPIHHIPYINDVPRASVVKGDGKSISIAAASIIAKVERDLYMNTIGKQFPQYNWNENKGYGTLKHRTAIKQHGVSSHHRSLFVRNILQTF